VIADSSLANLTMGPIRSGPTALEQLPALMRELGVGRAAVVHDESALQRGAVDIASTTLSDHRIRFATVRAAGDHEAGLGDTLEAVRLLNGGLVISLGGAQTVTLGKTAAAAANNGDLTAHTGGDPLPRAPLPHIAVPTGIWPPEEATDTIGMSPTPPTHRSGVIRDRRLAPTTVIDARLHSHHDPRALDEPMAEALAVAACAATDATRTLDEKARALAAAHALTTHGRQGSRFEVRVALTLAGTSHRDYLLCRRCAAGHHLRDSVVDRPMTPAEACLREALGSR
jgi:alcohol dehydrogenase class IV